MGRLVVLGNFSFPNVCFETHFMRCNAQNIGEEEENVFNKFWDVKNIEAKENCVIHNFEIIFYINGQRYLTKLLCKPVYEFLVDNFMVREERLEKIKSSFDLREFN